MIDGSEHLNIIIVYMSTHRKQRSRRFHGYFPILFGNVWHLKRFDNNKNVFFFVELS